MSFIFVSFNDLFYLLYHELTKFIAKYILLVRKKRNRRPKMAIKEFRDTNTPGAITLTTNSVWYRKHRPGPEDNGEFDNMCGYVFRVVSIHPKVKNREPFVCMAVSYWLDPPDVLKKNLTEAQRKSYNEDKQIRFKLGSSLEVPLALCTDQYFEQPVSFFDWREWSVSEKIRRGFKVK